MIVCSADFILHIATSSVAATEIYLSAHLSAGEFEVTYAEGKDEPAERTAEYLPPKRVREADQRLLSGDAIAVLEGKTEGQCTLGWGNWAGRQMANSNTNSSASPPDTASPSAPRCIGMPARRNGKDVEFPVGKVTIRTWDTPDAEGLETDAEAFRLDAGFTPAHWIWATPQVQLRTNDYPEEAHEGEVVCHSGINGGYACGAVKGFLEGRTEGSSFPAWKWFAPRLKDLPGDSGGPVWNVRDNAPVGIISTVRGGFTPVRETVRREDGQIIGRNPGVQAALDVQIVGSGSPALR
jgi:hypothetical protein